MREIALVAALVLSGCGILTPAVVDCRIHGAGAAELCAEVVAAANRVLPRGADRISVNVGRSSRLLHAEVHACYPDGRYLLVDVFDDGHGTLDPSIRPEGWEDPPCR